MRPKKETVWNGLNIFLYGNFLLLSSLEEAKPGYRTFRELASDTKIKVIPVLGYLLRLNTEAKTIEMKQTPEDKLGYGILPKGEDVLAMLRNYHEAYDIDGVNKWLEEIHEKNS